MNIKTLIFLNPFTIKSPTLDEHNDFMMRQTVTEMECAELGTIFGNDDLYGKDVARFINEKVVALHPEWIVAEGMCVTVVLKMNKLKKILINPRVTAEDLNNVSEQTRQNTFGFFDDRHEQDYERFQSVYPHAAWFPQVDSLTLFTIKETVQEIIENEVW